MTTTGMITAPKPLWEAGVLSSPSSTLNYFSYDDTTGFVILAGLGERTAFAVCNPNLEQTRVTVDCYAKTGALHATQTLTLAGKGHRAMYAHELFQWAGGLPDRGYLRFTSPRAVAVLSMQEVAGAGASVFSVNSVSTGASATEFDTEPNDDFATAQPIPWVGEVRGTISAPGDVGESDVYVVNLEPGYFLSVLALARFISSPARLTLSLYGPDRQLIKQGTDLWDVLGGFQGDRCLSHSATISGPHYIVVGTTGGTFGTESVYRVFTTLSLIG
jgi:hypothetical protein